MKTSEPAAGFGTSGGRGRAPESQRALRAPLPRPVRWAALAVILASLAACIALVVTLDPESEPNPWGFLGVLTALAVALGLFAVRVARGMRTARSV